jgi:hypothetical protein
MVVCIGLCIDALRRSEWITQKGTKSLRFIFATAAITLVFLAFGWFLSRHTKPTELARRDDPVASQLRLNKITFHIPVENQKQLVDIGYSNNGPSNINLKLVGAVAIVDMDTGKITSFDGHREEIVSADIGPDLENKVWETFLTSYKQQLEDKTFFYTTPPFRDSWSTITGPGISGDDVVNINANTQKVLIFVLGRFIWTAGGSSKIYGYDVCEFITGSTQVVFDCSTHNGPTRLR